MVKICYGTRRVEWSEFISIDGAAFIVDIKVRWWVKKKGF